MKNQKLEFMIVFISLFISITCSNKIVEEENVVARVGSELLTLENLEEQLNQILRQAKTITKITGLSIDQVEDLEKIDRYLTKYMLYKNSK